MLRRVVAPYTRIDELTLVVARARLSDVRISKNAMTPIQPTIGSPNEAVQRFMSVVESPTIKQDLARSIRNIIAIRIWDETEIRRRPDIDPAKADRDS